MTVSFQPQYRQHGQTSWINFGSPLGSATTAVTVTGLTSNTSYDFQIVATTDVGTSLSSIYTVSTLLTQSFNPAQTATALTLSNNNLTITDTVASTDQSAFGLISAISGKYYWEFVPTVNAVGNVTFGIGCGVGAN